MANGDGRSLVVRRKNGEDGFRMERKLGDRSLLLVSRLCVPHRYRELVLCLGGCLVLDFIWGKE